MRNTIKLIILVVALNAAAIWTGVTNSAPTPNPQPPIAPARDADPQPPAPDLTQRLLPLQTFLVHPDGVQEPVPFNEPVNTGDEVWFSGKKTGVERVLFTRFEIFDTYTARLIFVQELPNGQ